MECGLEKIVWAVYVTNQTQLNVPNRKSHKKFFKKGRKSGEKAR